MPGSSLTKTATRQYDERPKGKRENVTAGLPLECEQVLTEHTDGDA